MTEFKVYENAYKDDLLNLDENKQKLFIDFNNIADDGKILGASIGNFNSIEQLSGIQFVVDSDIFDHIENLRIEFVNNKPKLFIIDEEQFEEDKKQAQSEVPINPQSTGTWQPL